MDPVLVDSEAVFPVDGGTSVSESGCRGFGGSTLERLTLGDAALTSHCSLGFSALGVASESPSMSGRSLSDSRYGCREAGVRCCIVGDVIEVRFETLEVVRSIDELAEDGEPDSDSGKEGSCSKLAFDEVLSGR